MEAKELQIGDLAILKETHSPHKITRTDFWGSEGSFKEFEPIPLSEDILAENTFEYNDDWDTWVYMGKWEDNFTLGVDEDGQFCAIVCCKKVIFRYVHELQHILRSCNLNDLANNFII